MMKQFSEHSFWKTHALLIARVLMGGMFLMAGVSKLQGIDATAAFIASAGIGAPVFFAWFAAIFETVLGLYIIVGRCFRRSAILLALFTVVISFIFHSPSDPAQQLMFTKNMAIVAGLLFMAAHGAGNTWRLGSRG